MFCKVLTCLLLLLTATTVFAVVGVSVEDNFYSPQNITVAKGTTVQWTWNGLNDHSVTSGTPSSQTGLFDSGLHTSGTFSFTFNNTGTFQYFCLNHGTMGMVGSVTVTCSTKVQLLKNPGFESGKVNWVSSPSTIINNTATFPPHSGTWKAQLNGKGTINTATLYQQVTIPSGACTATLSFFVRVSTTETTTTATNDKLKIQILNGSGTVLKTLVQLSNLNKTSGYVKKSFNVIAFKGQTIRVRFLGTENASLKTTFLIDDTALNVTE